MKLRKILLINLLILLIGIIIIEILFGNWLKSNNFGYSIRDLRNVNIPISVKFDGKNYNYVFKRNNLGFIGEELNPKDIQILFLGGSTGEEMFKPPEFSIVNQINSKLSYDQIDIKIINASKAGKSTRGYVNDFEKWFSKIENFNPKIVIFYLGINDSIVNLPDHFDEVDKKRISEKFEDYFKNNSALYLFKKKIQNAFFNDLRTYYGLKEEDLYNNFNFIDYDKAEFLYSNLNKNEDNKNVLKNLYKNLENLNKHIKERNFLPIFITQVKFNGIGDYNLFLVNQYLKKFCDENNYPIVKLDELSKNFIEDDFYDEYHTTINGSVKIGNLIYPHLKQILIKNFTY